MPLINSPRRTAEGAAFAREGVRWIPFGHVNIPDQERSLRRSSMVYLRPSWLKRRIEPVVMSRLPNQPSLRVRGRVSGHMRTIPVRPVRVGEDRYLVALVGETQWARNLRASGTAELVERGVVTSFKATEVDGAEQAAAVAEYLASSTYRPTVRLLTKRLPDPTDHPVFRID